MSFLSTPLRSAIALHARAAEAVAGELGHRRAQDLLARAVGIARAEFDDGAGAGGHAAIIHQTVN